MAGAGGMNTASVSEKPRVLFVDDEPSILSGLRDQLRRDRQQYEMVFAVGAREA